MEKKRIEYIKKEPQRQKVFLHSCGSDYEIIPDLIGIGLDGLNSLQPFAKNMEPEKLKKNLGINYYLWGTDPNLFYHRAQIKFCFVDRLMNSYGKSGVIFSTTHVVLIVQMLKE